MKNPKISIIVSVYNTEKYLKKSIDSILNQTYENIELIIIDDGSSDNSRNILKKYEKRKNIKIIENAQNMGLAYSRNIGLDNATGDYISFIDSDDFIANDYIEKLINNILENNSDISICDFKLIYEENSEEKINECCYGEFNLENVINNGLAASCCNKLFKRSIINKYRFENGKINEDIAVVIPVLVDAKKISYAKNCYYNYYQRKGSIQNSKFSYKRFDIIEAVKLTETRINKSKNKDNILDSLIFNQIILLLYFVIPKERNIFRRYFILKKYRKLTKGIKLSNNKANREYVSKSGRLHSKYYPLLLFFIEHGFIIFADLLILVCDILKKVIPRKNLIKKDISLKDVITQAKKQASKKDEKIKVSVVIPNYNYEKFLYQRVFSVLYQKYKIYELIILDDCSKDNSRDLIDDLVKELSKYINVKKIYNKENSGIAFKQWKKGFENASGDYVWIAEADDYCSKYLISNIVKPIEENNDIVISYSDTTFINSDGIIIMKTIKPEIDIMKTGHWDKDFLDDGIYEVENYAFLNCTIANVSSALIKNADYSTLLDESCNYRQAGDWVFYINLMKKGKISFINKQLNYYRVHGNNISSTMNHKKHIDEILSIHDKIKHEFKIDKKHIKEMEKRIDFLCDVWGIENEK